jgi:hypothetical protein
MLIAAQPSFISCDASCDRSTPSTFARSLRVLGASSVLSVTNLLPDAGSDFDV